MIFFNKKKSIQESGVLQGSTDRHTHILHAVDDGISTLEQSLAVLDYLENLGVNTVWCTPHIMEDVPNTTEALQARFGELQAAYTGPIRLKLAAEYMIDNLFESRLQARDLLTMEDNTVLMESSTVVAPYDLKGTFQATMSAGYRPLFAHPERYRFLEEKQYKELHVMGVKFQLNLASLTGFYGPTAQKKATWLLKQGLYSSFGSDCHRLHILQKQYSQKVWSKDLLSQLSCSRS